MAMTRQEYEAALARQRGGEIGPPPPPPAEPGSNEAYAAAMREAGERPRTMRDAGGMHAPEDAGHPLLMGGKSAPNKDALEEHEGLFTAKQPGPAGPPATGAPTFAPDPQQGAGQTWGGGGGYAAPHMGVTSRSTQQGVQFSPETLAARKGMAEHGHNAAALGAQAEMQQRAQAGELAAAENTYAHGERAQQHLNEGRRGIEHFEAEQQVRDKKYELQETPATVPEYFAKQGTAGKVTNLIGLALGGALAGVNGGENQFLRGIQNNIAAQMGKKGSELDFATKGVRSLEGTHDRARVEEARRYMQGLEAVRMEMGAQAKQSGDPGVMARYEENEAKIDKELTTIGAHLDEVGQSKVVEHESMTGGTPAGAFKEADLKWAAEQEGKLDLPGLESNLNRYNAADAASGGKGLGWMGDKIHSVSPTAFGAVYGGKASEREQAFAGLENAALHTLSGAAVSPSEMTRLMAQFRAAHTPESRGAAIGAIRDAARAQHRNINSGMSDGDMLERERRMGRGGGAPPAPVARPPMKGRP